MNTFNLINDDCLNALKDIDDNSIDSIITDPPYGLSKTPDIVEVITKWLAGEDYTHRGSGFMGKSWDSFVPGPAVWRECFRVLKPGGHLIAFAGSRTYDLMAIACRMGGFEIRDQGMWLYGSGFPKSLDVSKAIDKKGGSTVNLDQFKNAVVNAMRNNGVTRSNLQAALGNHMLSHYLSNGSRQDTPNIKDYRIIRDTLGLGSHFDEFFLDKAEREVAGMNEGAMAGWNMDGTTKFVDRPITTAKTPEAQKWQGWGTALKPAHEPFVIARKPFKGTVADNVLEHGVGGINVDGCRVETDELKGKVYNNSGANLTFGKYGSGPAKGNDTGRFPANLLHDGSEAVEDILGDKARYFYSAKAGKKDRNEGLEGFEEKKGDLLNTRGGIKLTGSGNPRSENRKNNHPTVKPVDLMAYLCRLITPEGGTVLDPFTGSGSTGKAAIREGFNFIGIEMDPEYCEIAKARIEFEINKT